MISNKNYIYYKVLDLVELYNFDINFIFIRLHLKKYEFICVAAIFKDGFVNTIFRGGYLKGTIYENH